MSKASLFEKLKRDYVSRYHTTDYNRVASILNDGVIKTGSIGSVFTSASPKLYPPSKKKLIKLKDGNEVTGAKRVQLEIEVPKDWHKNNKVKNVEYGVDVERKFHPEWWNNEGLTNRDLAIKNRHNPNVKIGGNTDLWPVDEGGRVETYNEIPASFIKKICVAPNECYEPNEWLEKFGK